MEMSKYQIKLQEMKKEKSEWQSKAINSIRDMVVQQNTDTIIDQLTDNFELNDSSKTIDEVSQKIKVKYSYSNHNDNANEPISASSSPPPSSSSSSSSSSRKYLLIFGLGIIIGYLLKDRIKRLLKK